MRGLHRPPGRQTTARTQPSFPGFLEAWDRACLRFPDRPAFVRLDAQLEPAFAISFAKLDALTDGLAATLRSLPSVPVLLWLVEDDQILLALIACFKAGRIAVPAPRRGRRGNAAIAAIHLTLGDCVILHGAGERGGAAAAFPGSALLEMRCELGTTLARERDFEGKVAYLQFTSGSTRDPRGVRITGANLAANVHAIASRFAVCSDDVYCHWLPLHHDMGLVTTLTALAWGCTTYRLTPEQFARCPDDWLRALDRTGATFTGAPNSALERSAERQRMTPQSYDLSRLKTVFCGAEPVQPDTLARFATAFAPAGLAASAIAPCYGLAESTLIVSGGRFDPTLDAESVACGAPVEGTEIRVVDPDTGIPVAPGEAGEIWVRGASVAAGYHGAVSDERFDAQVPGEPHAYLCTGDLGRVVAGRLHIHGRRSDMVIVEGRNVHLCDVDATLVAAHAAISGRPGAAIALPGDRIAIVQELRPNTAAADAVAEMLAVRVMEQHGIAPARILLVRPGAMTLTTSGKVRRDACAALLDDGHPATILRWPAASAPDGKASSEEERIIGALLAEALGRDAAIDPELSFAELGLSSSRAAELLYCLSMHTGIPLDTSVLFDHGSIRALALHVRGCMSSPAGGAEIERGYSTEARAALARAMRAMALDASYETADGDYLVRDDGGRVLDLVGGFGTALFGHNHPTLTGALRRALDQGVAVQAQGSIRRRAGLLAAALSARLEAALGRGFAVSLWSTGAEAVEAVIRHARLAYDTRALVWLAETDRGAALWSAEPGAPVAAADAALLARHGAPRLVSRRDAARWIADSNRGHLATPARLVAFSRAFHGKTSGAGALTHRQEPTLFGAGEDFVDRLEMGDAAGLEQLLERRRAPLLRFDVSGALTEAPWTTLTAVIVEPVQSEGGVHVLAREDAWRIRAVARDAGVPLIADEIQCGFGRCGVLAFSAGLGLDPDYVLLGKALGGGLVKLAALAAPRGADDGRFAMSHSSTFADDDLSALVGLSALDLYDTDAIEQRVGVLGEALAAALNRARRAHPGAIRDVRGAGCLIGVELQAPAATEHWLGEDLGFVAAGYLLHAHGIRVLPTLSAPTVLRIEPSAYLGEAEVGRIETAFADLARAIEAEESPSLIAHLSGGTGIIPAPTSQPAPAPLARTEGNTRVAFLSYLVEADDLAVLAPRFAAMTSAERECLIGRVHRYMAPRVVRRHRIDSACGASVEVLTIGLTLTSALIAAAARGGDTDWLRAKVREGLQLAMREGCSVAGLGGYLSIFTDDGLGALVPGIEITTGNALTAAALCANVGQAAARRGLDLGTARMAIIGATGNIGSFAARHFAGRAGQLDLIGRVAGSPALTELAARLSQGGAGVVSANFDALRDAQIIISATSAPQPIVHAGLLGPDTCILCDVAVPGDVDPELASLRPDIEILRGGVFAVPHADGVDFTLGQLPPGNAFACMSEAMILGLDGGTGTIGIVKEHHALALLDRALHHGFRLSAKG
ncbi:hypothetical protein BH10PSE12_BH10PSE12_15630 [soil metagenome]